MDIEENKYYLQMHNQFAQVLNKEGRESNLVYVDIHVTISFPTVTFFSAYI